MRTAAPDSADLAPGVAQLPARSPGWPRGARHERQLLHSVDVDEADHNRDEISWFSIVVTLWNADRWFRPRGSRCRSLVHFSERTSLSAQKAKKRSQNTYQIKVSEEDLFTTEAFQLTDASSN